jgi:hypothetical protein
MTMDDVISCLNVVKYYNPSMSSLYDAFVTEAPNVALNLDFVTAADETGQPIYETLVNIEVGLANAIHDYVYNIVHPFDSMIVKNIIREQMCRDIFGLEANF